MGAAASSSPPPPLVAATAASDPPTPTPETAAPPANEDLQKSATAAAAGAADDAAAGASPDPGGSGAANDAETVVLDASAADGEAGAGEEQGECSFCLFMKGGGCKEEFTSWEKCVEEAEAATGGVNVVERCQDITAALRKCMDAHADYYEPILRAERAMAADLEAFKAQEEAASAVPPSEEGQKKQAADAAAPPSEEGQEKQAADVAAPLSEEGQEKQAAAAALSEESIDPAA